MSDYSTLASAISTKLRSVSGFSGQVFAYIPNVSRLDEIISELTTSSNRLDAWFISRTGMVTLRYGETGARITTQHRVKRHLFTIRGYVSVAESESETSSEVDFQSLCDEIEGTFAPSMSLGQADNVFVSGVRMTIGYEMLGGILCHRCLIELQIDERLATSYQL